MRFKLITISSIFIFIFLVFTYKQISKNVVLAYYDEELWIAKSYFFQFYITQDFDMEIWDTEMARTDPMLVRFMFGAWNYPKYLEQKQSDPSLDYTKFLIKNGFYYDIYIDKYVKYKESLGNKFTTLETNDYGRYSELIDRYGENIRSNLDIINHDRDLNIILFSFTCVIIFLYFYKIKGLVFSLSFLTLYASNSLLIDSGIRAHSDTLLVLFFNITIIYMLNFFLDGQKLKALVLFSLFLALSFTSKLNGIMLYFPFALIAILNTIKLVWAKKISSFLLMITLPLLISITVFTLLNPYGISSPIKSIQQNVIQQIDAVNLQITEYPEVFLHDIPSRIKYLTNKILVNNLYFISNDFYPTIVRSLLILIFLSGLLIEINKIRQGDMYAKYMIIIFITILVITLSYLQLAWDRYLMHLIIFFVYYSATGLSYYVLVSKKILNSIIK